MEPPIVSAALRNDPVAAGEAERAGTRDAGASQKGSQGGPLGARNQGGGPPRAAHILRRIETSPVP